MSRPERSTPLLARVVTVLMLVALASSCTDWTRDLDDVDRYEDAVDPQAVDSDHGGIERTAGIGVPLDDPAALATREQREAEIAGALSEGVALEWAPRTRPHCAVDGTLLEGRLIVGDASQRWPGEQLEALVRQTMDDLTAAGVAVQGRSLVRNVTTVPFYAAGWAGTLTVWSDRADAPNVATAELHSGELEADWRVTALVANDPSEGSWEGFDVCR